MSSLSIIIPCYNEEKRLNTEKISDFVGQNLSVVNLIFVNDGSTDKTFSILKQLQNNFPDNIDILTNQSRQGKAASIRNGILKSIENSTIKFHGFMDADLALPFSEFKRLYTILSATEKKYIFGSRIKKIGANIQRNEWRHFYSRFVITIIGFITKMKVYDTQCSAKIFRREIIQPTFSTPFKTKWLFDAEIICRLYYQYGALDNSGIEEPLNEWTEMEGSKLRWTNFFSIVKELFLIKKYYQYHENKRPAVKP